MKILSKYNEKLVLNHILFKISVTVVGIDGRLVYETIIRPDDTIIDYNTRFSGVTARDLKRGNNSVKSLKDVQNDLLGFINANTILIGHGLENDLRALKVRVRDVIFIFGYFDTGHRHVGISIPFLPTRM